MDRLKGRVAIVTASAGAGIGQATARRLAAEGAAVVISDIARAERRIHEAVESIRASGGRALGRVCDVLDPAQVGALVEAARKEFGRVDILVNNAGREINAPVAEMTDEVWDTVVGVNLTGAFHCTRAVLPHMVKQRWGRIVSLASIAAWRGPEYGGAHYAAAKGGIIGFTRAVAREVAPHGVTANAVAPGFTPNPFLSRVYKPEELERMARMSPMGRGGRPEEIAATIAFLASDEAEYITGETVCVSGGGYIR